MTQRTNATTINFSEISTTHLKNAIAAIATHEFERNDLYAERTPEARHLQLVSGSKLLRCTAMFVAAVEATNMTLPIEQVTERHVTDLTETESQYLEYAIDAISKYRLNNRDWKQVEANRTRQMIIDLATEAGSGPIYRPTDYTEAFYNAVIQRS
jgi:hypothetical protein